MHSDRIERDGKNESEITCIAKPHAHYAYNDSKCMRAVYITAAKCASEPTESNSSHWNSGTLVQRYKRCLFASHRINYSIERIVKITHFLCVDMFKYIYIYRKKGSSSSSNRTTHKFGVSRSRQQWRNKTKSYFYLSAHRVCVPLYVMLSFSLFHQCT